MEFRFNADEHTYIALDTGETLPHITGLLGRSGWVDDEWYTEASAARGTAVHDLTAAYDLGALDVPSCTSKYRGYLLAHVKAMEMIQPEFLAVEEPLVHDRWRFGGRPDRVGKVYGQFAVLELKSGARAKSHPIQTALQAILVAPTLGLPPVALSRFALYWKANGKFAFEEHTRLGDLDEAYRILRCYSGR